MNHLENLDKLNNRYFLMRHGHSKANLAGVIISYPESGLLEKYGLTELGRQQAERAASRSKLTKDAVIYSSDFSRARETAEIVQQTLKTGPPNITAELRERHFGKWEAATNDKYHTVWQHDSADATHTEDDVEAVDSVLSRTTLLIQNIEKTYKNKNILLISHGDTLQILQTAFSKMCSNEHRTLPHLETAEIREVKL